MTSPPPHSAPRVVIPIVAGIGNALLAVPMVRRIKRAWPEARVTILARIEPMAEVFRRLPEVDEVVVTGKGVRGVARMIAEARRRAPDVYLVPFPSNRWQYSLLAATSGAKRRVLHGYPVGYWRAMHFLPATRVPAVRGIHDVEQNLLLLAAIGIEPHEFPHPPIFPLTDDDRARAAGILTAAGLVADVKPIIVHAGSAQTVLAQAKRWPTERYRELIAALRAELGDRIIVVEGPDEAGVGDEIAGSRDATAASGVPSARVIKLSGPLAEAAALLERAELYVGTDSGLAHLAAAVGTPAVTIFAPADPDRVCPYGYRNLVVQPPPPCAPSFLYPWESAYPKLRNHADHRCIDRVTVGSVMDAVRRGRNGGGAAMSDVVESRPATPEMPASPRRPMLAMRIAAWAICGVVLFFVIRALVRQFHAVEWAQVDFKPLPAIAAVLCVIGVSAMQLVARWTLLIAYGYPLSWRVQLPVAWVPQLGKYVPGGIASVGGAVYLLRRHGVPGAIGLSVAVLLDALAVMAGLIVSTPLLLWRPVRAKMPHAWLACAALIAVGIVMLHPRVFVGLLNFSLRLIKRQPIAQTPPLSKYLWPVLASFGQWLFAGFGLWFMTMSVTDVTLSLVPLFIASAALAMTVSYLMPFTPGGIGIREGLYLITLGPTIGPRVAIVVVAMRVVQTVIEIVLAGVGAWVMRGSTAPASDTRGRNPR